MVSRNTIIPPPIAMTWQLTLPEEFESSELHNSDSTEFDKTGTIYGTEQYLPVDDYDENIMRILVQYNHYHNYKTYSSITVNGYIRNLQPNINSIIPSDINALCLKYYFKQENNFIHISYNLYKMIHETTKQIKINYFSGKVLTSTIKSESKKTMSNINDLFVNDICNKLIEYKFIEMVSCKTCFSALLHHPKIDNFCDKYSNDTIYQFASNVFRTFQKYSSMQKAKNICKLEVPDR